MTEIEQNALTDQYVGLMVGIQGIHARIENALNRCDVRITTHWDVQVARNAHDKLLDVAKYIEENL